MSFLAFFSRSSKFNAFVFMKKFGGKKKELKKLKKDELDCLLHNGFYEANFPIEMLVDYLIEIKWNFNETAKANSCLPLNWACSHGNLKIVKKMIEAGADIHANKSCALNFACRSGNLELVQYLLSLNVDVNSVDVYNYSTISSAIIGGNYDIFALLIERGADIETLLENSGATLLHSAVSHSSLEIVEKLVELGADINAEDLSGWTVLYSANDIVMIKKLIELGAPVAKYCQNSDFCWETPIMYNDVDFIKLLIANGAKLYHDDLSILFYVNGGPVLYYRDIDACCYESYYDESEYKETSLNVIEYLLSLDLDINQQYTHDGTTPFMQICINGTLAQVILLLNHGANPFLTDSEGISALHYAAHGGNSDIIAHLINNCEMDPNVRSLNGQTPLHLVREYPNSPGTIETFIKLGADINAQDNQKQTPIHVFTQMGYYHIVDLLLKHGARNDIFDFNSKRPIDMCSQNTMLRKVYSKYSIYQFTALEAILSCFY